MIPQGAIDLVESERGLFCIVALVFATVLVALGKLPAASWLDFTKYLVGILVASKTVTGAIEHIRKPVEGIPEARVVSTPAKEPAV